MAKSPLRRTLLALLMLGPVPLLAPSAQAGPQRGPDDAVVIAVIDSGFSPYHWDFLAAQMPQAQNSDHGDDLPLHRAPHGWLPGFPRPATFGDYKALKLTLEEKDEEVSPSELAGEDTDVWNGVRTSTSSEANYYWLPGTKVIGAMTFGVDKKIHGATDEHGMGTTSVSVGNIYGACPECLLVFIQYGDAASAEVAINWAMSQPWIDAISNSYGFGTYGRERIYSGSNTALQREASERGQTIFFSAGNGVENAFTVPNTTLKSSQEGPDWIVTVTATDPNGGTYTGTGKPADVAGIGTGYPSAYNASTQTGGSKFGGTSNATPTLAGMYGRALYGVRRALPGRSRLQSRGVIASGSLRCGRARRDCELADGKLTVTELRFRLLQSAVSTGKGYTGGLASTPPTPRVADTYYAAEGHGTYTVKLKGEEQWQAESARILRPLLGTADPPARPAGERDWFLVDSWCRQQIWGEWAGGYYVSGKATLPAPDPVNWPTRTALQQACPLLASSEG